MILIIAVSSASLLLVLVARALLVRERSFVVKTPPPVVIDAASAAKKLSGAVRIKTIACDDISGRDMKAFRDFARYLGRAFPAVHRVMTREAAGGASLLYRWHGRDTAMKPALFCAHIDVVPVESGTGDQWRYPPFSGAIKEGSVWGRGTLDIKNQLVALLEAAELMIEQGFVPERDIYFAFGHDEETRGNEGADVMAAMLKERGVSLEYVLDEGANVLDNAGGGIKRPVAFIGIAEKGFVNVHISARGAMGHSSMPPMHTAAGRIARAVAAIESKMRPPVMTRPVLEMIRALAPAMPLAHRVIMANLWLLLPVFKRVWGRTQSGSAYLRTTAAPTMLLGSNAPNVLPQSASAVVNARIIHGESSASLRSHLEKAVNDRVVTFEMRQVYEPSSVSPADSPAFNSLAGVIKALWPHAVIVPCLVTGGTDARKYEGLTDCVYRFTPVRLESCELDQVHGTNEHISLKNIEDSIMFYTAMFTV